MGGRRRLSSLVVALTAAVSGSLWTGLTAAPAAADSSVVLDGPASSVVTDPAGHVWVASLNFGYVLELDQSGHELARVAGESGVSRLSLSPDGSTLLAADSYPGEEAVVLIDTATATETARYALGAGTCPQQVVQLGSELWVSEFCDTNPAAGRVAALPVAGGTAKLVGPTFNGPELQTFPGDATRLMVYSQVQSKVVMYTATGGALAQQATATASIAVTAPDPDGSEVDAIVDNHSVQALSVADLSTADPTPYPGHPLPTNIATRAADSGLLAVVDSPSTVTMYRDRVKVNTISSGLTGINALAWSHDGSDLYLTGYDGQHFVLQVLTSAEQEGTSLTIATSATSIARGQPLTLSGRLTAAGAPVAGAPVTLSRIDGGGTHSATLTTDVNGDWVDVNAPPYQGTAVYTVAFAGNQHAAPASASTPTITVIGSLPVMTISSASTTYSYGQAVQIVVSLGPTSTNRSITLYAQPYDVVQKAYETLTVNSHGNAIFTYPIASRTVFTGYFSGDAIYSHRTVALTILAHGSLSVTVDGAYTTVNGMPYIHHTVTPELLANLRPAHAACYTFQADYLVSGTWRAATKDFYHCGPYATLTGLVAGREYRVRAEFAGDKESLSATAPWKEFLAVT